MSVKVVAAASGGGHWRQLMEINEVLDDYEVIYISTTEGTDPCLDSRPQYLVRDCNARQPIRLVLCAWDVAYVILRERPALVISTGAAPGLLAVLIGRLFGASTIWIDSVANSERLSMSGRIARFVSTRCLTQWPHLQENGRVEYLGGLM